LLHRIALAQTVPAALPDDLPELADIGRLATQFDPQEVQLYYQITVHGRNEIGLAPDEYAGFTMTLLRMLAFRPGQGGAEQAAAPAPAALARPLPQGQPARPAAAANAPAAPAARPAGPAASAAPAAPAPQAPAAPASATGGAGRAMTSARAALDAALEAARAGSRMGGVPRRPAPPADPAPAAAHAAAAAPAPAPAAPAPGPAAHAAPARTAPTAPWEQSAPGLPAGAAARPQPQAAAQTQPQSQPPMGRQPHMPPGGMHQQAQAQAQGHAAEQAVADDEPPSWVTEFSDDSAVAMEAPAVAAPSAPARVAAPSAAPYAYVVTPVPAIGWDGNWPALAASLPLRGVAQQLAFQTELVECKADDAAATFRLRVPVDTLRASGNSEKLCAALQERFPAIRVNVETEIAPTWYTANAEAKARRERLQREAEATVDADPFVQDMVSTFDAFVVPGSVRPIAT